MLGAMLLTIQLNLPIAFLLVGAGCLIVNFNFFKGIKL
jgi:hypothetical protein